MNSCRSIFLILALFAADACAQGPAPEPKQPQSFFRTLGLGVNFTDLFYMLGKKDMPIHVTEDARSEFYPLPAGPSVEFYRMEKAADGSDLRIPVAKAVVPSAAKLLLFVFSRGGAKSTIVESFDDSLAAFPGGSYRVLNRLDQAVEAKVKEQKMAIPARGDAVMDARGPGPTRFVQMFVSAKPKPRLILSNNWAFYDSVRTLVVVSPSVPPTGTPLVARITEPVSLARPPEQAVTTTAP